MSSNITPSFSKLTPTFTGAPPTARFFADQGISLPDVIAPYAAAHGFFPSGYNAYTVDEEFAGWILSMNRSKFLHSTAVDEMLGRMNNAYNEGRFHNNKRYEDLIANFEDLISKSQSHMDAAKVKLEDQLNLHLTTLTNLEDTYSDFFNDVKNDLDNLSVTLDAERTRVNNTFDALLAQSDQGNVNRGFYSSGMIASIDAGIETKRNEALTEVAEKEKRLIADIALRKNEVYVSVLQMRSGLIGQQMELTNREQTFLGYQLDTRNNLAMAMYGFVERREDVYPGLGDMAALVSSLGTDT